MKSDHKPERSLRDIEMEVLEEGREWTRRRLEQRLQEEATRHGGVFPPSGRKAHHRKRQTMHLRSVVGVIELQVWQGHDPRDGHWGSPVRELWGLKAHQQMSPALEEKLAFTATLAGSYAAAGQS